jgi:hypothetical protein
MSEIGRKETAGKLRWDLLPIEPIREVVRVLTYGAKKYSPHNWKHVPNAVEEYYAAMMRHVTEWRLGVHVDPETNIHHLAHAMCDAAFILWFELTRGQVLITLGRVDDDPAGGGELDDDEGRRRHDREA